MLKLNVPDMSCGHCAAAVTKAVKEVDDSAVVEIDLPSRTVAVKTAADPAKLGAALADAGYPATAA